MPQLSVAAVVRDRLAPALAVILAAHGGLVVLSAESVRAAGKAGGAPALDRGGFTVDLSNAGVIRVTGDSVLQNGGMEEVNAEGRPTGWAPRSYVWLWTPDPEREPKLHARIKPHLRWETGSDNPLAGSRTLSLTIPRSAHEEQDPPHEYAAYWNQSVVPTESAAPRKYVFTYHYRGKCVSGIAGVVHSDAYVRVSFYDDERPGKGKSTRVYAQRLLTPGAEWRRGQMQFVAPKGTRRMDVWLAMRGCGQVWFDEVALGATSIQDRGPTTRLMPGAFLDNLYQLSTGDVGAMVFGFYNEAGAKIGKPQLLLQLPQGVQILELAAPARMLESRPVAVDGGALTEYRIDVSAWKGRIRDGTYRYPYNMWQGLLLVLRTSLPAGEKRCRASYWLEDGDYCMTPLDFEIQVVPPVPTVGGPQTFKSGAVMFLVHALRNETAVKAFAELYKRVGFNAVQTRGALNAELGRLGIERYPQPFANGYRFGDARPGSKPNDAVFRLVDGRPLWEAVCPVEIYTRGPYFRQGIERDILRKILVEDRSGEQIMANWEPHVYRGRGCFCARCKEEFRTYSKLQPADVERAWPKDVATKYADLWLKFRSWQHAQLMVTIEETVHALGKEAGLDAHFIPEIHHRMITERWAEHTTDREYAAVDYLDRFAALTPWAPYNWFVFGRGPYDYVRGLHLTCHTTSRDVRRFLADRLPPDKQPRLFAFPYGTYEGATEPESIGFEILTYFLNGYAGAFVYLFPGGYDARYWKALAETNRLLAQFESFVCGGQAVRSHQAASITPMPSPDPRFLAKVGYPAGSDAARRWQDLPLLLSWEFKRDRARLFAVGNFWERGECFFRLKPGDLGPDRKYVLHEPAARRVYADESGNIPLRSDGLRNGILLHAGAMRYSFFVLDTFREGADHGAVVRPQDMAAAMRERQSGVE